jgi:hypothetical protein
MDGKALRQATIMKHICDMENLCVHMHHLMSKAHSVACRTAKMLLSRAVVFAKHLFDAVSIMQKAACSPAEASDPKKTHGKWPHKNSKLIHIVLPLIAITKLK